MDRASSLIFPGSRTLSGWWRQLQHHQPQALQVGYGHVHRIEALTQLERAEPIDAITQMVLRALGLKNAPGDTQGDGVVLHDLGRQLCMPAALVQQILIDIEKKGLIAQTGNAGWHITEQGRHAGETRQYGVRKLERRVFSFLEQLDVAGLRSGPPLFLPIAECAGMPWQVEPALRFEPGWLEACIGQNSDWKRSHGFPQEIEMLVQDASAPAWQQVIVDRPERVLMVLICGGKGPAAEWLGFAVRAEGWEISTEAPIFRLTSAAWNNGLVLTDPPSAHACQNAWRSWCRERQLPPNETESCVLSYEAPRLHLQAPERFVQRLRAAKSDLLKGEAWLLLGEGYMRTAALLALTP
jgi:hypothetical protein